MLTRPLSPAGRIRLPLALVAASLLRAPAARSFGLDDVARVAEQIGKEPYRDRQTVVPKWMLVGSMTYDQWRDIRFRPDRAL